MTEQPQCPQKQALLSESLATLLEIEQLVKAERDAMTAGSLTDVAAIDKHLEMSVGKKERAIGAYLQHLSDHGC